MTPAPISGSHGFPGHRFFFFLDEVEPLGEGDAVKRVLVAGVGNVFLGDDAFGVEVVRELMRRPSPAHVTIRDFGTRGLDLAYTLVDGFDALLLVDTVQRGHVPGTLTVLEPDFEREPADGRAARSGSRRRSVSRVRPRARARWHRAEDSTARLRAAWLSAPTRSQCSN